MARTIVLNSTESLPIPPRSSSRSQHSEDYSQPAKSSPLRPQNGSSNSPYTEHDSYDDQSDASGNHTPPSPSPSPHSGHSRDSSVAKRKAVPPFLPPLSPAADLPADHPFANGRSGNGVRMLDDKRTASIRSGNSGSEVGTPGWREEKDLFFSQQQQDNKITSLPPPPRKSNVRRSPATSHTTQSPSISSVDIPITLERPIETAPPQSRRGTFAGGLNIDVPGMDPEGTTSQISSEPGTSEGYETARSGPASPNSRDSTPTATPTVTPQRAKVLTPEMEEYYDRPLPPIPHVPSTVSLGMSSILAAGPASSIHTRSNSVTSRSSPTTPRLSHNGPDTPVIRVTDDDNASSIPSQKGFSALGGKKFPWSKKKSDKHKNGDEEDEGFSVSRVPSKRALWEAGTHFVRDENGGLVYFGDLFPKWDQDSSIAPATHTKAEFAALKGSKVSLPYPSESSETGADPSRPPPRTVMFFIRFFWCGQCQDYMFASVNQLDPEALAKANIRVVVISNGSWKYIKAFRKITKCPFPVYVDGPRKLYKLMGMTKQNLDMGPLLQKNRPAYNQSSPPVQIALSFSRAPRMPLTSNPGNITQLGGEFVLEPGFECSFAHRMTNFSNHMEAPDILRLAGCAHPTKDETKQNQLAADEQAELEGLQKKMNTWRSTRESELDRIRRKKAERRGVEYKPISGAERAALNLDATPAFGPTGTGRRESEVSAITFMTAMPEDRAVEPALEVSLDEDAAGHDDDLEDLEADDQEQSEGELDEEFRRAMKIEEEAKGRFETSRAAVSV